MKAEFFDIFGSMAFLAIVVIAIASLKSDKPLPKWISVALLLIGLGGLAVDTTIVYLNYFK
jgi:uncharacterized membrane protein